MTQGQQPRTHPHTLTCTRHLRHQTRIEPSQLIEQEHIMQGSRRAREGERDTPNDWSVIHNQDSGIEGRGGWVEEGRERTEHQRRHKHTHTRAHRNREGTHMRIPAGTMHTRIPASEERKMAGADGGREGGEGGGSAGRRRKRVTPWTSSAPVLSLFVRLPPPPSPPDFAHIKAGAHTTRTRGKKVREKKGERA